MSISFLVAVIITASCLLIEKSFSDPTVLPSQNLLPDEILFEIGRHDSDDPALIPKLRQVFKSFSLSSRRHMYMRNNFSVFRTACRKGDVDMMKRVYDAFSPSLGYSSIMQPAMIEADTFGCFREAAENGGLPALHLLYGLCNSSQRVDSLMAQKEYAVR